LAKDVPIFLIDFVDIFETLSEDLLVALEDERSPNKLLICLAMTGLLFPAFFTDITLA